MARRSTKVVSAPTTPQRLGALIKSCRDTMRKDKGLNGDLDRLPMLTWIMFLKFLDDMERIRKDEAAMEGRPYHETIEKPYRWRDWSPENHNGSNDGLHNALTGDALLAFINQDEAIRPDGERGLGLFAYLRSLQGKGEATDRRDVVATVFHGTVNRMQSGYLLRDVLNLVNGIHFSSSDEIHTLGHFYESMLREMRDAAGDAGEFYTPRPLVQMIVKAINPQPGETILDPAAGTGGFLVAAYQHLRPLSKTVQDLENLERSTLFGIEAKSLPYLLCQMNLVLHGVETPHVDPLNALRFRTSEIGDRDRVDVIVTNPPFGGQEEKGIQLNFPSDKQTAETALLFLQLIMRKLRRPDTSAKLGGRAGVIVPNGVLFGDGVAARIKQELLDGFNLHTVVRLPPGIFAPYTPIPTNVLFFERSGPTREIWFFEHQVPGGRKAYIKTQSLEFDDFGPLWKWWSDRIETEQAWKVPVDQIAATNFNLDLKNPHRASRLEYRAASDVAAGAIAQQGSALSAAESLAQELKTYQARFGDRVAREEVSVGDVVAPVSRPERVDPERQYRLLGARWYAKGLYMKDVKPGYEIKAKTVYRVEADDFVYNRLFAWQGSFAVASEDNAGSYVSNEFLCYRMDPARIRPKFLWFYFSREEAWKEALGLSTGSTPTSRNRLKEQRFLAMRINLPALAEQDELVSLIEAAQGTQQLLGSATETISTLMGQLYDMTAGELALDQKVRGIVHA